MRIRQGGAPDAPDMARMIGALFAIEKDFAADPERQLAGLRLLLASDGAAAFVAEDEDEDEDGGGPYGMVTVQLLASTAVGGPSGLLEDLYVDEDRRLGGVASALVAAAEDWCRSRGAGRIQLLADVGNEGALRFYDAIGYGATRMAARRKVL